MTATDGRAATALADAIEARDAAAFVHVGDRSDATMRYLAGPALPDRPSAFLLSAAGERLLCPPPGAASAAREVFDGTVVGAGSLDGHAAGERAAAVLAEREATGTVLSTATIPHAAALYLDRAGYGVASTDALDAARATKTEAEIERIRAVQTAAAAGVERAEAVLADAERREEIGGDADADAAALIHGGDALTTASLRREVNAALARAGVDPAGNTVVAAGAAWRDPARGGDDPIRADDPVLVELAPRDAAGYHGRLARTFVVDTDGGWDRRAHLAVTRAREAGLAELEAGTPASRVHEETAAEIVAYGFDGVGDGRTGGTRALGHGVGLARREAPWLTGTSELEPGHVVALAPTVFDAGEGGGVRIADLAVITEEGYELLGEYGTSLSPTVD
ncbi:Xaa-Pro aminopeptidase [Halarchaeum solikamskense]|uniref:M24 family metallopeptidase n=1 Tax=Halarchaeum nitratireducens TaxID=489913 RepID=UPI00315A15F6|nr:Xaa-Pro aminopeptidase [Halarchaeum solikamskense]